MRTRSARIWTATSAGVLDTKASCAQFRTRARRSLAEDPPSDASEAAARYVGQSVPRREDRHLLLGQTTFLDDLVLPGMLWVAIVRSPFANARIVDVDTSAALDREGVVAALSGKDLMDEWAATLPCVWKVTDDIRVRRTGR